MTPEELLKALAEADGELQAPPYVEARLRAAFRAKHASKRRWWIWIPMAAAAAAALVTMATLHRPKQHENPVVVRVPSPPSEFAAVPPPAAPTQTATVATVRPSRKRSREPREIMTDFIPLVADAPPISDGAALMRVSLPASAMRDVGLPVREDRLNDRVQADVLVNYGMATAVRFVSYQK